MWVGQAEKSELDAAASAAIQRAEAAAAVEASLAAVASAAMPPAEGGPQQVQASPGGITSVMHEAHALYDHGFLLDTTATCRMLCYVVRLQIKSPVVSLLRHLYARRFTGDSLHSKEPRALHNPRIWPFLST